MSPYSEGYERTQAWLREHKRTSSQAFARLTELRSLRHDLSPGSVPWMATIGETTALLRAFPHLASRERVFSPTNLGPNGAGVE